MLPFPEIGGTPSWRERFGLPPLMPTATDQGGGGKMEIDAEFTDLRVPLPPSQIRQPPAYLASSTILMKAAMLSSPAIAFIRS